MVKVKNKLGKKHIAIIITASVLVLLIGAYVLLSALINSGVFGSGGPSASRPPEVLEGESVYNNRPVAYPYIAKSNMISIAVSSHKDAFVMSRPEDGDNKYENYFMLYYGDEDGELNVYYPDIMNEENNVDYSDFYAVESSDGLNMYKLDYVCATIGALYFDQRIEPEENREAQLNRYGLGVDEREVIYFTYLDSDGKQREHRIFVGDSLISGVGYYFMIEGRDYIYTSSASERFEYLLGDFESFLHSRITAEGLPSDGLYEPYLTTDYKQWTNKYYGINSGGEGMIPTLGSEVVINAEITDTVYNSEEADGDGYRRSGYEIIALKTDELSKRPELNRLLKLVTSTAVGDYSEKELLATVITNVNEAEMGVKYSYQISKLESVIAEDGEHTEAGFKVGDNNLVKVEYIYRRDGVVASTELCHAVIDLSADTVIPDEVIAGLKSAAVGDSLKLGFEVTYTEENAVKRELKLIVTDIHLITKLNGDGSISYLDEVTEDSIVTYSYKYIVDGYEIGEEGTELVDLSSITEGDDLKIKNSLIGMKVASGINKCVLEGNVYCQPLMDFLTYSIKTVKGFVEKVPVVSFEFVNASERDPFYGESIYKNTLENENRYYALDALACQQVTFLLGGIGTASSSQLSAGLSGSETVAVGLTPANLDKFGLYDGYTVYFELPRGITSIKGSANSEVSDYTYVDTLGCYLYISKENSDGTRYIGSSLYDIIVKIDGSGFEYLEKSFEEYWSRKNLVMVDYSIIDKLSVNLNMSDVFGSYEFDLDHKLIYISGNQHYDEMPEEGGTEYNFVTVTTRPLSESCSETVFSKILAEEGRDSLTLANLYNRVAGKPVAIGHDTAGTANFKQILSLLYGTNYAGVVSAEEREEAINSSPKIMSITFRLESSAYGYTYDFYRISDRRVMVHIYRVDKEGNSVDGATEEVSGFYISSFAAKKIVNSFVTVLNGQALSVDDSYWQ